MSHSRKNARLLEAAVELLRHAPEQRLGITTLNKALFYLDLEWLLETGSTVTNSAYIAIDQGPVVAKYDKKLVRDIKKVGLAREILLGASKPIQLNSSTVSRAEQPYSEIAEDIARKFSVISAAKLSEFSHDNPGWVTAFRNGRGAGNPPLPIDLNLAIQQTYDDIDDEWLCAPLTPIEERAAKEADDRFLRGEL